MKKAGTIKVSLVEAERRGPLPLDNPCQEEQDTIDAQSQRIAALEAALANIYRATDRYVAAYQQRRASSDDADGILLAIGDARRDTERGSQK